MARPARVESADAAERVEWHAFVDLQVRRWPIFWARVDNLGRCKRQEMRAASLPAACSRMRRGR